MKRRLKPVKDLSVLIVAPRRHDQQLWAELLKNCEIKHPVMTSDITYAATLVGSGQADVVFVDESYGAQGIANVLIPARNVEFSGGRGVCLILCSKQATAQDVMNARRLGFASLIILPASTGTVQKHLELAARYIPPSDQEIGWSAPKQKESKETKAMPAPKEDPLDGATTGPLASDSLAMAHAARLSARNATDGPPSGFAEAQALSAAAPTQAHQDLMDPIMSAPVSQGAQQPSATPPRPIAADDALPEMVAPGRSGQTAEEEVVFL